MALGTAALTDRRGDEQAVQGLAVAQVDQLGQAGHRQALVGAEMAGLSVFQGEMDTGAVDAQQAQAAPAVSQTLGIQLCLNHLVQGLEHGRIQLVAGLAEGRGGHLTGFQGRAGDLLEKAVQFGLQGRLGLIEQEQGQVFEVQVAAAGEILGTLAVFGDKGGVIQ